jgi:uncharacterized Zn ribbon protein
MAKFYADRIVEEPQIEEVKPPAGEFDCPKCHQEKVVKINGIANCLGCGTQWMNPADFHRERFKDSAGVKPACPKCGGTHLVHTGNLHRCFSCKHEWTTPGFGANQRRDALHKRAEQLTELINECATDCLAQLEQFFDQVEAAFPPVRQKVSPGNSQGANTQEDPVPEPATAS